MLEMGNRGQTCWIKPPNQCHLLWPPRLRDSDVLFALWFTWLCAIFIILSQETHSLCFPLEVFYFMLLIHQCYPYQWSERWLQPDSNLCGLWNKSCCVGCSLFSGVDIQKDLALLEKESKALEDTQCFCYIWSSRKPSVITRSRPDSASFQTRGKTTMLQIQGKQIALFSKHLGTALQHLTVRP